MGPVFVQSIIIKNSLFTIKIVVIFILMTFAVAEYNSP